MPDESPGTSGSVSPAVPPASNPPSQKVQPGPTINIGDEFGTAKRNLPPAKIVLMAIAGVLVVVAIAVFLQRAKPQASGSLDNVTAAELPGQTSTMVALTFTLKNSADKILYVRSIRGTL